jgi:hypothetical protein
MQEDVRDKLSLNQEDVLKLNFIREPGAYIYRRHYRQGLRSHILEVLSQEDVEKEKNGVIIDGAKWYPRAEPLKMLRIFRTRFKNLQEAEEEIERVKTIESYLGPENFARSDEFLVDYELNGKRELILCGLQEFIQGAILDPWDQLDDSHMISILRRISFETFEEAESIADQWLEQVRNKAETFIGKIKKMILEARHVPDLAGIGNLLLTHDGDIKLVDFLSKDCSRDLYRKMTPSTKHTLSLAGWKKSKLWRKNSSVPWNKRPLTMTSLHHNHLK